MVTKTYLKPTYLLTYLSTYVTVVTVMTVVTEVTVVILVKVMTLVKKKRKKCEFLLTSQKTQIVTTLKKSK